MSSAEPPNGSPDATSRFRDAVERLKEPSGAEESHSAALLAAKCVTAEQFVLVDSNGECRATLKLGSDGGPALALHDARGRARASIRVGSDGAPSLVLYDSGGRRRAEIALKADGSAGVGLYDEVGEGRAELVVSPGGAPAFSLFGPDGRRLTRLPSGRPR